MHLSTRFLWYYCKKKRFMGPDWIEEVYEYEGSMKKGKCVNEHGSFLCNFTKGWESSARCDESIKYCQNISCENGSLLSLNNNCKCRLNKGVSTVSRAEQCKKRRICTESTEKLACWSRLIAKIAKKNPIQNNNFLKQLSHAHVQNLML